MKIKRMSFRARVASAKDIARANDALEKAEHLLEIALSKVDREEFVNAAMLSWEAIVALIPALESKSAPHAELAEKYASTARGLVGLVGVVLPLTECCGAAQFPTSAGMACARCRARI